MNYYRRNKKSETPDNGTGYMMFVTGRKRDHIESYGDIEWVFDGSDTPHIETLRNKIISQWIADQEDNFDSCQRMMPEWEGSIEAETLVSELNPINIVDQAWAWDNQIIVGWLWDRVLEPAGIDAVLTDDGAIVFESELVEAV